MVDEGAVVCREAGPGDAAWVARQTAPIGGPVVVSFGRLHDLRSEQALVALRGRRRAGLVVFRLDRDHAEVLALLALEPWRGTGSRLLAAVEARARAAGVSAIRLTTTNDNTDALRFYQRRGFGVTAWRAGGFCEVLRLKGADPGAAVLGCHGIPIRDAVELKKTLT